MSNAGRQYRAGYSFTEVMFAVVVLGIGFIMIAAMFPVAISQQQSTQQETNAAAIARGAMAYMDSIAVTRFEPDGTVSPDQKQNMPATEASALPAPAPVVPFDRLDTPVAGTERHGWSTVTNGQLISANDRRYAFVPLYRREFGSSQAQVVIIVTQVRARSTYDATDYTVSAQTPRPNLIPREVTIDITNGVGNTPTDWITFDGAGTEAVAEGAYVVVGNSPASTPVTAGAFNGRIYRVGIPASVTGGVTPPANTWELQPGNDFTPLPGQNGIPENGTGDDWHLPGNTEAWIVGREYNLETAATDDFHGPAQDIAAYSSFITVR